MYRKKYSIHFVGIGGIGMSGIAELLLNLGYQVSGSDIKESDITQRLAKLGGTIYRGHRSENVKGCDVVVVSSAINRENPETASAREQGIPVIPRAEMLAELMRLKYSVAIAGAHGKTTTTSIVADVLAAGGLDPTVVIGGKLLSIGSNAKLGHGEFIVAEADESDGSFLKMSPSIAVVTNIDREHMDHYKDMDEIKDAFARFIDKIPFYGLSVLCLDSEPVQDLIPQINKRYTTYGLTTQADLQAGDVTVEGLTSRFTVRHNKKRLGRITLNLPGMHNVYNSLASIAVGLELNVPFENIKAALESLSGVHRRLEIKGKVGGIVMMDDYGHHPTEIRTTLQAVSDSYPERRVGVIFQPHRYSRTQSLFEDFARAFYQADYLIVLPIYAAGERPIPGVDSLRLCRTLKAYGHKNVIHAPSKESALQELDKTVREGDVLITLGAGDVYRVGESFLSGRS